MNLETLNKQEAIMPNTINEKIYAPYTKHMTRAKMYTYRTGYEVIDQALVKDYYRKSIRQIADDLNEYDQRVIYRIQVLLKIGVLPVSKNKAKQIAAMLNA
jgi:hypothetical protein